MIRLFVNKFLNILSFIKTYPSEATPGEKLSFNTYMYASKPKSKRFHLIYNQLRIGLTLTNLSTIHFTGKGYIRTFRMGVLPLGRTMSTSSESESDPVLIYTNPSEIKGLIIKQNKGKSGVYR